MVRQQTRFEITGRNFYFRKRENSHEPLTGKVDFEGQVAVKKQLIRALLPTRSKAASPALTKFTKPQARWAKGLTSVQPQQAKFQSRLFGPSRYKRLYGAAWPIAK